MEFQNLECCPKSQKKLYSIYTPESKVYSVGVVGRCLLVALPSSDTGFLLMLLVGTVTGFAHMANR